MKVFTNGTLIQGLEAVIYEQIEMHVLYKHRVLGGHEVVWSVTEKGQTWLSLLFGEHVSV